MKGAGRMGNREAGDREDGDREDKGRGNGDRENEGQEDKDRTPTGLRAAVAWERQGPPGGPWPGWPPYPFLDRHPPPTSHPRNSINSSAAVIPELGIYLVCRCPRRLGRQAHLGPILHTWPRPHSPQRTTGRLSQPFSRGSDSQHSMSGSRIGAM